MSTLVDSHENLNTLATVLTSVQAIQNTLQLTYDTIGFFQDKRSGDDKLFNKDNPFSSEENGDYDSAIKTVYKKDRNGNIFYFNGKVDKRKVNGVEEVEGDEDKAEADPLNDEDKNPCIEHAGLHKTMMQGGGLEVEIIQEPDPRYEECYKHQKLRQRREELRKLL